MQKLLPVAVLAAVGAVLAVLVLPGEGIAHHNGEQNSSPQFKAICAKAGAAG